MNKSVLTGVLALGLSTGALAELPGPSYAGIDYTYSTYEQDTLDESNPSAIGIRIGRQLMPIFAIEGRIGTGISDDTIDVGGIASDLEIDSVLSALLRGELPLTEITSLYVLAGFSRAELSASTAGIGLQDAESGFSWGGGVGFSAPRGTAVTLEYLRFLDEDDFEFSGLNLGVHVGF